MSDPAKPGERPVGGPSSLAEIRRSLLALRERQRTAVRSTGDRVVPVDRDRELPLSFTQQRLWFLDQWAPGKAVYNAPIALHVHAALEYGPFSAALTALVDRHEVLRTSFPLRDGVPFQAIAPPGAAVPLPVTDLTGADENEVRDLVSGLAQEPFDLANGPVLRAHLIRTGERDHVLVLAMHHIATDGWSTPILLGELLRLYGTQLTGEPAGLADLAVQYADYAVWQRGRMTGTALDEHLTYWKRQLSDLPTLDLPTDRPRPVVPTQSGATTDVLLGLGLRTALNELARAERVTLLTVVLSAFTAMLGRYTGQDDIVVGSVFSGRERPELEPLVGFFANTVVLRCSTAGDPTVRELLSRTNDTVLGAHFHQDLPFGRVVEELAPDRDPSRNPLFQTSFTLQHAGVESARVGDIEVSAHPTESTTARFDLAVQLTELPDGIRLWAEYSTDLFDADTIERMFGHYLRLLEEMVADPGRPLSRLPMLTEPELARLAEVRGTCTPDLPGGCMHELFESVVDASPDAVAVSFAGRHLTYRDLDDRANRLAWELQASGVGPESVVGVLLGRGPDLPIAFLGIQKAGGAYLPLDPDHPPARWAVGLAEARCGIVVTTAERADELPAGATAVPVDAGADDGPGPVPRPRSGAAPGNLAYVIFTSGSTGRPKGVQVEHRSIVNFTAASIRLFGLGTGDRVLQFANPAYDVSLFDFFSALCSGAELVAAPTGVLLDADALTHLMRERRVTVTDLPPAVLGLLDPADFPDLRALFVGLEAFPGELVNRWNGPDREFHNGYGPTEATVACTDYLCPDLDHTTMPPIGTPLANYRADVVDRYGDPAPTGVPGELLVGGVGVARGYAHQPGLTAERFVPDPFGGPGARRYRTGDLVRRLRGGDLEFLGRVDNQIKIRGLRVEPGEVEHAILTHPAVAEAVVVPAPTGSTGLHCFLSPVPGRDPEPDDLRHYLIDRLPAYLVPDVFTVLPELPRASSGKLDRTQLPAATGNAARPPAPPTSPTELMLAEIWREVLDDAVEPNTRVSFFAIGGNSLKVTQLASRIRAVFDVELELRDLFVHSTIAELAELIEATELDNAPDEELAALLAKLEGAPE
jgi:amino acid adenylation domain-containing protein